MSVIVRSLVGLGCFAEVSAEVAASLEGVRQGGAETSQKVRRSTIFPIVYLLPPQAVPLGVGTPAHRCIVRRFAEVFAEVEPNLRKVLTAPCRTP